MTVEVPWLTESDDAILEFLAEYRLALPPRTIEYNLATRFDVDLAYSTINHHLKKLAETELLDREHDGSGFYAITDLGVAYLEGTHCPEKPASHGRSE